MDILEFGKAICYSGYRAGQSPKTEVPSKEQIAEDLHILAADGYRYLRMYDPNLHARRVLEVIREEKLPMKCLIGVDNEPEVNNPNCPWDKQSYSDEQLKKFAERNDNEFLKLIELVKEYDDEVIAVSVGNENTPSWGARIVPEARLIEHADQLREALHKPVTFCEGFFEWPNLMELSKHLDFISVHSYPWHYGKTVDVAVDLNKEHYHEMKARFADKQVLFTEVGWTSNSDESGNNKQATVANQKRYITELNAWLEEEKVVAFLFEAFDEPWKASSPEKSECNWGLYTLERTRKW
ncbi:MAG: hypothetical protein K6G30_04735 [Acetatifactor sp.]|nr:hypothetical protein [Acetatifactor sp.]